MAEELHLDLNQSLELRKEEFKNDPEKMKVVNDFLSELFEKAQKEAEHRNSNRHKGKLVGFFSFTVRFFIRSDIDFICRTR